MSKNTYLDTVVLIAAAVGTRDISDKAFSLLAEGVQGQRKFVGSDFLKIETIPKAVFHKNRDEEEFYNTYFQMCEYWANFDKDTLDKAIEHASEYGMSSIDALHVISAYKGSAQELITGEKKTKPMFRTPLLEVTSIR
jgi:predicted nucleic acid-binding protein